MKPLCLIDSKIELNTHELKKLEMFYTVTIYNLAEKENQLWQEAEILLLHSKLNDKQIKELVKCRFIAIRAHNLDYVNQVLAQEQGIEIKGITPVGQIAVAEHTFGLIFALAKQLQHAHSNLLKNKWRKGLGFNLQLHGKTLGIIGKGAIAQELRKRSEAFGLKVLMVGRNEEKALNFLLQNSDIISLHIPSNPQNYHFIDELKLSQLKSNALLINTSRGDIMDYESVVKALESKRLGGLGVDVFPIEPPQDLKLLEFTNVIATPHVAFNTMETIERMNEELVDLCLKDSDDF